MDWPFPACIRAAGATRNHGSYFPRNRTTAGRVTISAGGLAAGTVPAGRRPGLLPAARQAGGHRWRHPGRNLEQRPADHGGHPAAVEPSGSPSARVGIRSGRLQQPLPGLAAGHQQPFRRPCQIVQRAVVAAAWLRSGRGRAASRMPGPPCSSPGSPAASPCRPCRQPAGGSGCSCPALNRGCRVAVSGLGFPLASPRFSRFVDHPSRLSAIYAKGL